MQPSRLLANGVDPSAHRRAEKSSLESQAANSFEVVGREWFDKQKTTWADTHTVKQLWMLEKNLLPWLGSRPIAVITPTELLTALRRVEGRGAIETAKRVKQVAGQVFRYAVATGRAEQDPSQDLRGALAPPVKTHLAAITEPAKVGPLLRALDTYQGTPVVRSAFQLAPLVFTRPGELRQARWIEVDLEAGEWRIPADAHEESPASHRSAGRQGCNGNLQCAVGELGFEDAPAHLIDFHKAQSGECARREPLLIEFS